MNKHRTKMPTGKRTSTRIAISLAAIFTLLFLHIAFAPLNYFAVRSACESEGGSKIFDQVAAHGYWHGERGWSGAAMKECVDCADQLLRGDFEYIDSELFDVYSGKSKGFARFRVGSRGEGACYEGPMFMQPPDDKCVLLAPLAGPPTQGYKFESRLVKRNDFGARMLEQRREIIEIGSGRVLARNSFFLASTPFSRYGKFAAPYHCKRTFGDNERNFVLSVLRGWTAIGEAIMPAIARPVSREHSC